MTGGLLNLISYGSENVILNGNPTTTFFKGVYAKYTNFGLQKFRIDYNGQRHLQTGTRSQFNFTIPRHADLLWDTYVMITLPDIYSPAYYHEGRLNSNDTQTSYVPYEFRWVDELGTTMIEEVEIQVGGATITRYSGEYLSILNARDSTKPRRELWNKMTGNVPELNNPAMAEGRNGIYPTVIYLEDEEGTSVQPEPSIRGREIAIPLEPWFGTTSKQAFPLVAVQNNEMTIRIHFRPVEQLFRVRNVNDTTNEEFNYVAPSQNKPEFAIQRFLYPPTDASFSEFNGISVDSDEFSKMPETWNADIHLVGTYVFLSEDERRLFAEREHTYLIRDVFEYDYPNIQGSSVVELDARDCVSTFIWRFRRSDVPDRNEWSNYTNWEYSGVLPVQPIQLNPFDSSEGANNKYYTDKVYTNNQVERYQRMDVWAGTANIKSQIGALYTQQRNSVEGMKNQKDILLDMAIVLDGKYRENLFPSNIYRYIESYARGNQLGGNIKDGVYLYSFGTSMDRYAIQPTGAMNLNHFRKIQFEFNTINPPVNPEGNFENICEVDENGNSFIIGTRKQIWKQYEYNFDMRVFEERYNIVHIRSGNVGLMFAR